MIGIWLAGFALGVVAMILVDEWLDWRDDRRDER